MKKLATIALSALGALSSITLAIAMAIALTGCGPSDESVIRNGLTDEFNRIKDPGSDAWSGLSGELSADTLAAWLEGFTFEIGEITIEGDSATVAVTITCKQLYPAVQNVRTSLQEDASLASMTNDEIKEKANKLYLDELNAARPVTTTVTIPCAKNDRTWIVTESEARGYTSAMLGSQLASPA
jgi:hypothetical protein